MAEKQRLGECFALPAGVKKRLCGGAKPLSADDWLGKRAVSGYRITMPVEIVKLFCVPLIPHGSSGPSRQSEVPNRVMCGIGPNPVLTHRLSGGQPFCD